MSIKLLIGHHLEFLIITRGSTGSSESIYVKIKHCWESRVPAHILFATTKPSEEKKNINLSENHRM